MRESECGIEMKWLYVIDYTYDRIQGGRSLLHCACICVVLLGRNIRTNKETHLLPSSTIRPVGSTVFPPVNISKVSSTTP